MAPEHQERAEQVRNARKKVRRGSEPHKVAYVVADVRYFIRQLRSFRAHKHPTVIGSQENTPPSPATATLGTGSEWGVKNKEDQIQQDQVKQFASLPSLSSSSASTTSNTATSTTTTASKRHSRLRQSSSSSSASSPLQPRFAQSSPYSTSDQRFPEKCPEVMTIPSQVEDNVKGSVLSTADQLEVIPTSQSDKTYVAVPANTPIIAGNANELPLAPIAAASAPAAINLPSSSSAPLALLLPTSTTKHGRTRSRHTRSGSSISGFGFKNGSSSSSNSSVGVQATTGQKGADRERAGAGKESLMVVEDDGRGWETRLSGGPGPAAGTGTGSIRAVQQMPSPLEGMRQSGFSFGRAAAATTVTGEEQDNDHAGLAMPVLPASSSLLLTPPPQKAQRTDPTEDECDNLLTSNDQTFSFPDAATSFSFPQSRSHATARTSNDDGNMDGLRPLNAFTKPPPAQLVMPSPFSATLSMPLPVPELTVVPSTPIGEETFRYGNNGSAGSIYGLGFGFFNNASGSEEEYGYGPAMQAGEEFALPAFPTAFAGQDVDVSEKQPVDMAFAVEREEGETTSLGDGRGNGNEDEKSRFKGFSFGSARQETSPPPPPTGLVPVMEQEKPSADTRRRRHSHTRSTSISTRAAFIPNTSISALLSSSSETTGRALSRSPSPSDHLMEMQMGAQQPETMEERQRALFALEGRDGRVSPSAGGEGETPRWLAGLQAFAGVGSGGVGIGEASRTTKRSSRRRSRIGGVSETTTVEIALPPMDDDDLPTMSSLSVGQGQGEAGYSGGLATTGPAAPLGACGLNGLGIEGLMASTSMASQATNLGTLIEEDESEVAAPEPRIDEEREDGEKEKMLVNSVFTPDRALQLAIGTADSPDVHSATSFKIRPLRLLSMSSNSTNSFSSAPADQDAQSVGSRRSLSIEALISPSTGKAIENASHVTPLALSDPPKRFSVKRNSAGMGSKLFSNYTTDFAGNNKRSSVASSHTSGSRVLNEVEDTPHGNNEKDDLRSSSAFRRRSMTISGQNLITTTSSSSGETVDELKRLVAHLEMEKHTMQEDIEGWQSRCQGLEMQLKHEKEQGVFLRERVRKLGDHLSSLSGLATSSTPSSPYHAPNELSSSVVQSPKQVALMRNELFKLTSVIAQLTAEKEQAKAESAALRAKLESNNRVERSGPTMFASPSLPVARIHPVEEERKAQAAVETDQRRENPLTPRSVLEYNDGATLSRISAAGKLEGKTNADRIRGFSFPRGSIPSRGVKNAFLTTSALAAAGSPVRTTFAQSSETFDEEDDSTAFQIPSTHACDPSAGGLPPLDYKGYARQIPSLSAFTIADTLPSSRSRCIGFENTCGSCRGKVFHL
ncbi:hypothetical protein QFC21_006501 [Naganishia friedmannii]|uniref:Uncharacterized protein n=1 Tax=Naganishia friedmannii TaxID=89922 RepID=A0ACC2V1W4_9TREE|nr:hypothetical protein QFC21_006501 [Naganishia friedmannii]